MWKLKSNCCTNNCCDQLPTCCCGRKRYLLLGAPNVGKSTLFNKLSKKQAVVSNMDRITVNHLVGRVKGENFEIVDEPGIYNLSHPIKEEVVVANDILDCSNHGIINVLNSESFERDLLLTIQSIESGCLRFIIFNKFHKHTNRVDLNLLSKKLNNVKIISRKNNQKTKDYRKLLIRNIKKNYTCKPNIIKYDTIIESKIKQLSKLFQHDRLNSRFISIMLLENNTIFWDWLKKSDGVYNKAREIIADHDFLFYQELITNKRMHFINNLTKECIIAKKKSKYQHNWFDRMFFNPWIGIPLFILLILAIYYLSFGSYAGGWLKDQFDSLLNDTILGALHQINGNEWVKGFFFDGIFGGAFAVLSFLPTVIILFGLVSILQQTGIIPRVSILLDHAFKRFGLSGRSIVNLLTGFGCNVPAIMMARSSNTEKERLISIFITPFIMCSARIIVLNFIISLFASTWTWLITLLFIVLTGTIALMVGLVFSKTMFRKMKTFFIVENVAIQVPDFKVVGKNIFWQTKEFLLKIVTTVLIANLVIWLLLHLSPKSGMIMSQEQMATESFLYYISYGFSFLLYPIFGTADWRLTASLFCAIPAKEVSISAISTIYGSEAAASEFFANNLAVSLSYLTFFMFYLPCTATIGIFRKETNTKLALINIGTSLTIAYVLSLIVYWTTFAIVK